MWALVGSEQNTHSLVPLLVRLLSIARMIEDIFRDVIMIWRTKCHSVLRGFSRNAYGDFWYRNLANSEIAKPPSIKGHKR